MRKLNDIGLGFIGLFFAHSMAYYTSYAFRMFLAITMMVIIIAYIAARLTRKKTSKKLIGGQKISIA
jgi:hypothetical protein